MKDKVESTDNIDDFDEDIPFQENWKRYDVETIKRDFCSWIDRLYIHIQEKGYTDEDPEDEGYYCIVEPFETKRVEDLDD
jgi:hypothetical protein